ncbi:uncharacterized protein N7483_011010 [Penicillium malachiteum]|uniref:uncharacterized protein n=1 Tax=Penicillium malachiteum TaxID=1324776 RepID=UPI002547269F|nr:uncharacterized protein N7483_011010 [Penicillium malachiteum]KAJ5713829.1 hypothetical protein N7483_011010 [Penicillium malachiteum]
MGTLITLFTLPILLLISIPLVISAGLTISLAVFTLLLQIFVVYLEVGVALVINFFTPPTSTSTSSFLTFAPSEPPTPAAGNSRRNSNSTYNLIQSRRINDTLSSWGFNGFQDDLSKGKKKKYARSMVEAHHLPNGPLSMSHTGLPVSGDERRDFEGVGGWRSYPDISSRASKPRSVHSAQEKPLSSRSSSSAHSIAGEVDADPDADIDADERAWLSLNHRLELPSQVVTFGASSALNSPTHLDSLASSYALLPSASSSVYNARANTHANLQPSSSDRRRHHHRSHTTSALSSSDIGTGSGLSLSLSTRPDYSSSRPVSPSTTRHQFMTPQPYSPFQPRSTMCPQPTTSVSQTNIHAAAGTSNSSTSAGGGYFALSRPGAGSVPSFSVVGSPVSSGYTTPASEERDSALQLTRFIAHYPTSVRHRRRSLPGPHARRVSIGERLS